MVKGRKIITVTQTKRGCCIQPPLPNKKKKYEDKRADGMGRKRKREREGKKEERE